MTKEARLNLPNDVFKKLSDVADSDGLTVNFCIRDAIDSYLMQREIERMHTGERVLDVTEDAGEGVSGRSDNTRYRH
jgi:hypothetical protein